MALFEVEYIDGRQRRQHKMIDAVNKVDAALQIMKEDNAASVLAATPKYESSGQASGFGSISNIGK
jgi:hypothetical protein